MSQLVVWPGCIVGEENIKEFEKLLTKEGFKVKYNTEFKTLPDPDDPDTGGRNDVLFTIDDKDIPKFSIWRMQHGMRWWEDYLDGGGKYIVPVEVKNKYPYGWK